ncbi:MAG: glycosyltransferase [Acidobacteria bacterium]|nr:MAG: glycosyltransferase [Acidobacteriota bacterium]
MGRMGEWERGRRGERERREERGERGVTIMIYGRLSEKVKGTQLAVKACERLYKKFPNIRLLLFDTPVNESMAKAIENFKSSVPFEFITHHPVEKNVTLFHRADIFVAAEKGAGWANTVAEAMACGIPVVATRSGTADILINRETGLLVRRNAASIARGIRELIQSPGLRQQLAANGRKHIEQFDWHILANRIISWYGDMESKRQSPDHS